MSPSSRRRYAGLLAVSILLVVVIPFHSCASAFSTQQIRTRGDVIDVENNLLCGSAAIHHPHSCSRKHQRSTILSGHDLDSFDEQDDDNGSDVVSVTIQRTIPDATPQEVRNAFIKYHWKKGGGLPIAILSKKLHHPDDVDDPGDITLEQSPNNDGRNQVLERTILPILMKERAEYDNTSLPDEKSLDLHYKVTEAGPFFSDLVPGSHFAVVIFDPITANEETGVSSGCVMIWNVTFSTTRWSSLYEAVTKWTVGTAATTIEEASSTPRLFSIKTTIDGSAYPIDPEFARSECLDFLFTGGGLPIPPPIPYGSVLPEGGGFARQNLLRVPPLITESIIDTKSSDGIVEFSYRLNNPGWFTFPLLLHTHLGRVRFSCTASSDLVIDWDVEVRPYKFASHIVEKVTEIIVTTIIRNFRVRLTQPDAVVVIKPPRGNSDIMVGAKSLGSVAKDTWLGGVLDAHLSDTRSTTEQTLSLFQPWSWGRSGTGDENDCVQFQWTDGYNTTT